MLSVTYKPCMLSVIMLNVFLLSIVEPYWREGKKRKYYECSNLKLRLISSLNKQKKGRLKMKCLLT